MIRDIRCPTCPRLPEEGQRIVAGLALHRMRCDACNTPIAKGEPAYAVTTITDGLSYEPWEHEFLFGTRYETLRETK